jgi:hypothetical protein
MGPSICVAVMAHHTTPHQTSDHEEALQSLSQINTAPIPNVLSTDIHTQIEPSFISKKCKF